MQYRRFAIACLIVPLVLGGRGFAAQSGQTTHDGVLLGIHFMHDSHDYRTIKSQYPCVSTNIWDYFEFMPEDISCMSYADFWHWWSEFERYKGDEKGLAEMDAILDACLAHGVKVKIDLCHSTWWTNDRDWEQKTDAEGGPCDVDDWIHLCDLVGHRYRGRMALWHLQGEANDLKSYWQDAPIDYVSQIYRTGYETFKRADPGVLVSISGATPSMPRDTITAWVQHHAKACKSHYDDIPMNFFADVLGADPYHGLTNYYTMIRKAMDDNGQHEAEVGSGESSFQWAMDSYQIPEKPTRWDPNYDVAKQPVLSIEGQAWRGNESLGTFFQLGGNKFVFWGNEHPPGCVWPWRWGLRKYQDWWNIWPNDKKIPGTNIVFGYDNPDGRKIDYRPGWTSPHADPYYPIWHVYKYWAQAAPAASEAVRLPLSAEFQGQTLATYLRTQDRCVVLLQNDSDKPTATPVRLDLKKSGWADGEKLSIASRSININFVTGQQTVLDQQKLTGAVAKDAIEFKLPGVQKFTTIVIERDRPALNAECIASNSVAAEVGQPLQGVVMLRNTGTAPWRADQNVLASSEPALADWTARLSGDVAPQQSVMIPVQFPAESEKGYVTHMVRLREGKDRCFGPMIPVSTTVEDFEPPRKLVAFREFGHIRLKWFAPKRNADVAGYELYRAEGFNKPFTLLAKVEGTDYLDNPPEPDKAYYYHVVAVNKKGEKTRPSHEDNAKASSKRRLWDAEIVEQNVPQHMQLGEEHPITITLRNTGEKAWNLNRDESNVTFALAAMQLWGQQRMEDLPVIDLPGEGTIQPGETISVTMPYTAAKPGRFENHWILTLTVKDKGRVYLGTPLLVETVVDDTP